MAKTGKKIVKEFYTPDFQENPDSLAKYLHPEAELLWHSSSGFHEMDYHDIIEMIHEITRSYYSLRAEISHLLKEKDTVSIRFTYFVKTIENPREELPLAHFMAIWELQDGKLFRGYQISQPAE